VTADKKVRLGFGALGCCSRGGRKWWMVWRGCSFVSGDVGRAGTSAL